MCAMGRTGSAGAFLIARFSPAATLFQSEKKASGSSLRMRSTFSSTPPANTIGMCRVALLCRNATATSRPCEGSRSRSIKTADGGRARNWATSPGGFSGLASTEKPASFKRRARSRARSGFQQIRRTAGAGTAKDLLELQICELQFFRLAQSWPKRLGMRIEHEARIVWKNFPDVHADFKFELAC